MLLNLMKQHLLTAGTALALSVLSLNAHAEETIKVGVLHSLSGTMAISESTLKDTLLMLIHPKFAGVTFSCPL